MLYRLYTKKWRRFLTLNDKSINIEPDIKNALKNLGYTDYYIVIYIHLLAEGEMDARTLSTKTKVPYSRIYEVLNEMIKKGIISKIDGRPSTFIAVSPYDMFENLKSRQETDFIDNMNLSKKYLEQLYEPSGTTQEISSFIIEGIKGCMVHFRNIIKNTSFNLKLAIYNGNEIFPYINEELAFLRMKKIKLEILLEGAQKKNSYIEDLCKFCEIRYLDIPFPMFAISDDAIALHVEQGKFNIAYPNQDEYLGYSTNNASFAKIFNAMFDKFWELAK